MANPITRALRTYNSTLYALRSTASTARRIHRYIKERKAVATPKNSVVAGVRAKTRGALASNPKAFAKSSLAGQKRRDALAKQLKSRRVGRGSAPTTAPVKITRKPYSGKIGLRAGMTGRDLHRVVTRHAIKQFTGDTVRSTGSRKTAAESIKKLRRENSSQTQVTATDGTKRMKQTPITRPIIRSIKEPLMKKAVKNYTKAFKKK